MGSVEKRIAKLRDELNRHNRLYYEEAKPEISDQEYDALMRELIELEAANPQLATADSPSQRVGGQPIEGFKTVEHAVPMMSIDNTYDEAEVRAFDERVRKGLGGGGEQPWYVLEPKVDGVAASLRYEKGLLVLAATRGDGRRGDDITHNARTISSIPLRLHDGAIPEVIEVRGEVYMPSAEFQRINSQREADGEPVFANPRNSTAGTLKQLDPKIVAQRKLRFVSHGLGEVRPMPVESYWEWIKLLKKWGFPIGEGVALAKTVDDVLAHIEKFKDTRGKLAYQTDGMVVKVDSFKQRDKLGVTSKAPRWVIAFKYPAEQMQTKLVGVRWQVGKGGNLTPVADLEPVFIAGSTVRRATLHNIEQVERLGIHIGDTIVIEKAGEVIPHVVQTVPELRPQSASRIEAPDKCPSCGLPVEREKNTPAIRCHNLNCPAQLRERLIWFAGRRQMNIEGLGDKIIEQLVQKGHIKTYADLFRLTVDGIASLTRETEFGDTNAQKLVEAIHAAKSRRQDLLTAPVPERFRLQDLREHLGDLAKQLKIKGLGEKTIDQLVDERLINAPPDLFRIQVSQIARLKKEVLVGRKTAQSIVESAERAKSRGLGNVLAGLGIQHIGDSNARDFAAWAGSIERLTMATVDELSHAIANGATNPEEQAKVRARIHQLYRALHRDCETPLFATSASSENVADISLFLDRIAREHSLRLPKGIVVKLRTGFESVESMMEADETTLVDCVLGRVAARSLFDYLHSERGKREIKSLQDAGVLLSVPKRRSDVQAQTEWSGKTVVITGSFAAYTRDALRDRLTTLGAKVAETVSRNTDILLCGKDPGSKLHKAQSLGVLVWDESAFKSRLAE